MDSVPASRVSLRCVAPTVARWYTLLAFERALHARRPQSAPNQPQWTTLPNGLIGIALVAPDGQPIYVLKSLWDFKGSVHANLTQNWAAFVETIENPREVCESRRMPKERKVFYKDFASLVREDGRTGPGCFMAVVDRTRDVVVTAFIADNVWGKIGRRLWP